MQKDAVVVAVMLRPVVGRAARRKVLEEVAHQVVGSLAFSAESGTASSCICVVADLDVYQAILHAQEVDFKCLSARPGCVTIYP